MCVCVCIEARGGYLKYFLATFITWKLRYVRKTFFYLFSCVDLSREGDESFMNEMCMGNLDESNVDVS